LVVAFERVVAVCRLLQRSERDGVARGLDHAPHRLAQIPDRDSAAAATRCAGGRVTLVWRAEVEQLVRTEPLPKRDALEAADTRRAPKPLAARQSLAVRLPHGTGRGMAVDGITAIKSGQLLTVKEAYVYWQDVYWQDVHWQDVAERRVDSGYHHAHITELWKAVRSGALPSTPTGPRGGRRIVADDLLVWLNRRRLEEVASEVTRVVQGWLLPGDLGDRIGGEDTFRQAVSAFSQLHLDDTELLRRLDAHIEHARMVSEILHGLRAARAAAADTERAL
jgi:hypothetical protein